MYCAFLPRYLTLYPNDCMSAWAEVWAMDLCSKLSIYFSREGRRGATGGPALFRKEDGRSAWQHKQEHFVCFISIVCVYKKLFLHRWSKLVHYMKLSGRNHMVFRSLSQIAGGQPCWGRMMIDRHGDESKSILFAFVLLYVCIRSFFWADGVFLTSLWSLHVVAVIIYSSCNGAAAEASL